MAKDRTSRFLPIRELNVPVSQGPQSALSWLTVDDMRQLGIDGSPVFLGLLEGVAYFVINVSGHEGDVRELSEAGGVRFVDARAATEFLSSRDSGIVAQARAQVAWHNRHKFCSLCGHETFVKRGGQVRHCSKCDADHYPRTDPVVMTVVSYKDWCLLGRSQGWSSSTNRYSALAGFVDQGESIEEAVAREVKEEAGISVKNIRYHSSQPWPFPYSLMLGCPAEAATTDISMDHEEMADVRWFQRDEVLLALDGTSQILEVPGPMAIAHHMIRAWATDDLR